MKAKEEQIKGETFVSSSDLSDSNMQVKANGHREQAEVIGCENRSSDKGGRTLRGDRGDLEVGETWHERGNPPYLKWSVSQWYEPVPCQLTGSHLVPVKQEAKY